MMGENFLETERLFMRNFCKDDIKSCYDSWGQDESLGKYIVLYPMRDLHQMENLVQSFLSNRNAWVILDKKIDQIIGYVTVDVPYIQLGVGEIGYVIGEKYQKHGYAFEAVNCILTEYLIRQKLYMIEAKCNEANVASLKLLDRVGFQVDGTLRDRRLNLLTDERNDLIVCSITQNEFINHRK